PTGMTRSTGTTGRVAVLDGSLSRSGDGGATGATGKTGRTGCGAGGRVTHSVPSGGLSDGTAYNVPRQVDATPPATGVDPDTMTVTERVGSGPGAPMRTTVARGQVDVVNNATDALGAGWTIGGLQPISQPSDGTPHLAMFLADVLPPCYVATTLT